MADKKERFEVLLEAIQSDVKAVAEGQGGLQRQIDGLAEGQSGLFQQVGDLKTAIKAIDNKHDVNFQALYSLLQDTNKDVLEIKENLQRVETKLDHHIKQPAHA